MEKPTFKRELFLLVVLVAVLGIATNRLFNNMVPTALNPHSEFLILIDALFNNAFGTTAQPSLVIPIGIILGLMSLISLDHYKYLYGYILFAATVIAFLALMQDPTVRNPTDWAWMANAPYLLIGIGIGIVIGGLRWDRSGARGDRSLTHDYLKYQSKPGGNIEFNSALSRLLSVLGGLLVFLLFEYIIIYNLSPFEIVELNTSGIGLDVISTLCVLLILGSVRTYTADTNTILIGATGSGKTTAMAGLGYSAGMYTDVESDQSLKKLTDVLRKRGFEGITSTAQNENVPIQLSFKHGFLFPRRINLSTIDYAGELIESSPGKDSQQITVPKPAAAEETVITDSYEEAFRIARFLRWSMDNSGGKKGETFISDSKPVGIDPSKDKFSWPKDAKDGDEFDQSAVMKYIIQDMIYYADSIGLVLPMDDFGKYATKNKTPDWAHVRPDGELKQTRDRGNYEQVFDRIYDRLGGGKYKHDGKEYSGKGNDVFYLLTFADVAIPSFQKEKERVAQPATDRPKEFTKFLLEKFLPEYDVTKYLGGLYAESSHHGAAPEYDQDNARPVNFDVSKSETDSETPAELVDKDRPVLYGTKDLLERIGRKWK